MNRRRKVRSTMSSQGGTHPLSPPPVPVSPPSTGVRRHHTISASSRAARAGARGTISEETQEQQPWNDDEPVDEDWVGGVGAVGEKSSLHRQASLPTKSKRSPYTLLQSVSHNSSLLLPSSLPCAEFQAARQSHTKNLEQSHCHCWPRGR